jgi:hypothetical protein
MKEEQLFWGLWVAIQEEIVNIRLKVHKELNQIGQKEQICLTRY